MAQPEPAAPALVAAPVRAARLLEFALLFTIAMHAFAMGTMAVCLLPGMPGGPVAGAERAAYVAAHPWTWRVGWLGWQLTAISDLLLGIALVRTRWIPRWPAWCSLLATIAALHPDQVSQFRWVTEGVTLAQTAVREGRPDVYLAFEAVAFHRIAAIATIGYLLGALGWTWSFAAAGTWNRRLTRWSIAAWTVFALATAVLFLPESARPPPAVVSVGNALGFVLLMIWLAEVTELVLARARPPCLHGRYAPWRHPARGVLGRMLTAVGTSRVLRAFGEWLPVVAFRSDITDVVYVNYLVEADRLERFVPVGLDLQRIGPARRRALFSILMFRHGHFGPRALGALRRVLPSPVQSNWRILVTEPRSGRRGIYFVTNTIGATPHALAARMLSEGMPMHVPARSEVVREASGRLRLTLDPGGGSAPDLDATLAAAPERSLPPDFAECFGDHDGFLRYVVPQDRQLTSQPWYGRVTRQEIHLGIPLDACEPLVGEVRSAAARALVGDASPVCFRVARVPFEFREEAHESLG